MEMEAPQRIQFSTEEYEANLFFDCICRCCLTNEVELKPIFNSVGSIPEAVFVFTSVKFSKHDEYPGNICINCLHQLNKCVAFKRSVEASDLFLRKYLTDMVQKIIVEDTADTDSKLLQEKVQSVNQLEETEIEAKPMINVMAVSNAYSTAYSCTVCWRSYASIYAYNRHIKVHIPDSNSFRCNECGKKFTDNTTFEDHKICHSQKKAFSGHGYVCQICEAFFIVEQDLFVHSSLHEISNALSCKACGKHFESLRKLKRHIPRHFIDKPFKCNKCGVGFAEMASLTRHYQKHTGNKLKRIHICSICNKGFPNLYTLKVHTRNHNGERPWECTKCEKRFTDFRLLNSHKKLHEEDKPHKCRQCKNSFRHHSSLIAHMRTHTGDRPYRCDKCKKSYKQSWNLRIHKRTHVAKKSFFCDLCSQAFNTITSLKGHLHWHSNQNVSEDQDTQKNVSSGSLKCKECSAIFSYRLDLITHEKLNHALSHECDTCLFKWKTLEELVQHKCEEVIEEPSEPTPDEMILLPNGEIQDCNTVINALLASIAHPTTIENQKKPESQA